MIVGLTLLITISIFGTFVYASLTLEHIETNNLVPCVDKEGNPFEDELCYKTITCFPQNFMTELILMDLEPECDEWLEERQELKEAKRNNK